MNEHRCYDDVESERRVVIAMICERGAFDRCSDLGLPDLVDWRLRALLTAVRSLPNHEDCVDLDAVMLEIVRRNRDGERATITWFWLAEQLAITPPYRAEWALLEHDLQWLRTLGHRRESQGVRL